MLSLKTKRVKLEVYSAFLHSFVILQFLPPQKMKNVTKIKLKTNDVRREKKTESERICVAHAVRK